MKQSFTHLFLTLLLILPSAAGWAYDVQVDGIYYNLDKTAMTAGVAIGDTKYTGNVTSIGSLAFSDCQNINNVYCYAEQVPTIDTEIFKDAYIANDTLHVPAASIDLYKEADQWKDFGTIVALTEDDPKPTAIKSITSDSQSAASSTNPSTSSTPCYDLTGRHTTKPHPGLNIISGHKVIY